MHSCTHSIKETDIGIGKLYFIYSKKPFLETSSEFVYHFVILSFEYIGIFIEFYAHIWSRKPILVKDSYRIRISWTTSVNYDDDNYDDDDYVDGSRFWKLLLKLDSSFGCLTLAKLFSWILCLLSTFVFCLRLFLQRISCWNLCSSQPGFCVLS